MSRDLRILFLTRKWPPAMGGIETYAVALSEALARHGEVEVMALPGRADGRAPGVGALLVFGLATAARLIRRGARADVVHVADLASWPLALAARLRSPQVRVVLSAHGTDATFARRGGLRGRLYGGYLRAGATLLRQPQVLANSRATAEAARAAGFRAVAVVPLAARVEAAPPPPRPDPVILFCGRLIPLKGARWFAETVLPQLPPGLTLEIAGTVWDDDEAEVLEAARVRALGRLDPADLQARMRAALCVVMPNIDPGDGTFEGFGLIAPEAAAAGGVVLAADHGGLREAVIDGVTGFLLPSGVGEAWVAKIEEIAGWSAQTRADFLARSQAAAAEAFDWARVARQTVAHYRAEEADD